MSSNNDHVHRDGGSDQYDVQEPNAQDENMKDWFEEYMSIDGTILTTDHSIIKAVDSDILDEDLVERLIQESLPIPIIGRFCAKCRELFDNWPTLGSSSTREFDSKPGSEDGWEHAAVRPSSTFELEASTRSGCRFCAFLLQILKDGEVLEIFRKIEVRLSHLGDYSMTTLSIQNWGANPHQILWSNFPGKICDNCNGGIANRLSCESAFLPASADCYVELPEVLITARNWLSHCMENHQACDNNHDSELPTRLLSIVGNSPRLILTTQCKERPRYATLSYSWGSKKPIQLTSKNLSLLMNDIPIEILPTTFKDAINIAQKLHIEFLWIDSLCIIQDDEDDWQKESALMSSVYGGSVITIAASTARDCTEGCFLKPPYFNGGLRAQIIDSGRKRVQDFRNHQVYERSTFETHLGTRAWALQEKMLPPRTLHFGDRGAFWECRTTIASEFLPDGFPRQLVSPLVRRNKYSKFENLWRQIVQLYSAGNLTFGKDKLPALSGIAKLGHSETGDQYLAGLWRKQVEEQLCWYICCKASRRPAWRAPTWSWASVDGQVLWHPVQSGVLETKYAHVIDASTTPYGYDSFGQVSGGMIRLACSAIAVGYITQTEFSSESKFNENATVTLKTGDSTRNFPIMLDCLDDISHDHSEAIHLVPILGGKSGAACIIENEKIYEIKIEGIVLQRKKDGTDKYGRIGSFGFYKNKVRWDESLIKELYDPFIHILEEHGTAVAEEEYYEVISDAEPSDHRYIITII
ncbi:hypothetical protein ACMFMG_001125 [Clarireedia jacksonii]